METTRFRENRDIIVRLSWIGYARVNFIAPWEKVLSLIVVETLLGQFVCYLGVVLDRCVRVWMVPRLSVLTLQIAISRSTWIPNCRRLIFSFLPTQFFSFFFSQFDSQAKSRIDNCEFRFVPSLRLSVTCFLSFNRNLVTLIYIYPVSDHYSIDWPNSSNAFSETIWRYKWEFNAGYKFSEAIGFVTFAIV